MLHLLKTVLYYPLFNALMFLVFIIPDHNVGWAIIGLTVIIRLILLPSSLDASRQQKRMQEIQPELQAIQEKYKDDKQKQAEVLAQFYKDNKINPLGSCLPLLLQLPILIILYYVFKNGLDMSRFALLYSWVPKPDMIQTMFFGLDLAKPDKWVLPILAGLLQFYQGYQVAPKTKPGEQPEMAQMISKQMLYMMPIFTIFIAGRFPAALPLYWIITTLFAIGQQWWVGRENPKSEVKIVNKKSEIKKLEQKSIKNGIEVTVRRKGN
ncbi:MAG: YidC/Oxa1 family membrane protein insertase [Candidatus Berkelbacteria bacterium]